MAEVAARHGYDLGGHRGSQVGVELLGWADVVLAMDSTVLEALRQLLVPCAEFTGPGGSELRLYLDGRDVPDPWGGDEGGFAACLAAVEGGSGRHLGGR
jgi:protein-tyrosine phosphatase